MPLKCTTAIRMRMHQYSVNPTSSTNFALHLVVTHATVVQIEYYEAKKIEKLSFYKSICRCWYREAIKVVHSVLQTLLLLLLPDFKSLYQG